MAVPLQRPALDTVSALHRWLDTSVAAEDLAAAIRPETLRIAGTSGSGFSAENVQLIATGPRGDIVRLVARIGSRGHRIYPEESVVTQAAVQSAVGASGEIPVPEVLAVEDDPDHLGAPFFVMRFVPGLVAPDFPSHHRDGWLAELIPPERTAVWWSAITTLAALHDADSLADQVPGLGPGGPVADLSRWRESLDFYQCADDPVISRAGDWLQENCPPGAARRSLLWGDARLGNLVFAGVEVAAVLDWEMAGIGDPESDLAWFLYLDTFLSSGVGARRLYGLPSRSQTVDAYAALTGRAVHHLDYYTVLAGWKFALITAAVTRAAHRLGLVTADASFPLHHNAIRQLRGTLEEIA